MGKTPRKQPDSAGLPTLNVRAERREQSLAAEHTALRRRHIIRIGVPALVLAFFVGGIAYAYGAWSAARLAPIPTVPTAAATTAPALVAAAPTTHAPTAIAVLPTEAATAVSAVQPVALTTTVIPASIACPEIGGLPIYANASCIEHDADQDDGTIRYENTYRTVAAANDVRLFFEAAFSQHKWTISESEVSSQGDDWEYTVIQAQRRLRVDIETEREAGGLITTFSIKELSPLATTELPAADGSITCPTITGLPLFASATCVKHTSDQDNGIIKHETTYVTSTAADLVRVFYEEAFAQHGWSITETKHDVEDSRWSYEVTQAQQRISVEITSRQEAAGSVTTIAIEEK